MLMDRKKKSNLDAYVQLALMMILTIVTQVIVLLKTSLLASEFGISIEMDAFNFANNIGTFVYSFIGAGVTTVLIPNIVNKQKEESINIFISVLYSLGFIILIGVTLFRNIIVRGLSSGNEKFILLTCNIMFITLISQYINSFSGVTNAIFQCSGKFNFPKLISLITSVLLVSFMIFCKELTIYKYSLIILITTVINIIIQLYLAVKCNYKFKYKINFKDKEFKKMIKVFVPTLLGAGLYQISLLTDSVISSNLGQGDISKLSYSNNIISLVNMVIVANIITYFYPKIAKNINKQDSQKKLFDLSILINAIMIFIVVFFITLGKECVVILYERGEFTASITNVVYRCTLIYILALPVNALRDLIYRYFYAKEDTFTPFKNGLIVSCLNILISIVLARYIGIYGIVIGTTATSYLSCLMMLIRFDNKFDVNYDKKQWIFENIKLIIATLITVNIVRVLGKIVVFDNIFISVIVYGVINIIIYTGIIFILKSKVFKLKLND